MRASSNGPPPVALTRRQANIVWLGMNGAVAAAIAVTVVAASQLPSRKDTSIAGSLLLISALLTAVQLPMAYILTARIRRKPPYRGGPDGIPGTQTVVACALASGCALFSCVCFFIAREPLQLLLVVPCAAVLFHWRPTEERWSRQLPPTTLS